jgi:predicted O-methyltransferase YrrM
MIEVNTREDLGSYLNQLNLVGEGAEVGVWQGNYSKILLDTWRGQKLYLIDSWKHRPDYHAVADINSSQRQHDQSYIITLNKMKPYGSRVAVIREQSILAAKLFDDETLDFVYIDADHEKCFEDLTAWYPKVKWGGLVAGHDYIDATIAGSVFTVKSAVDTFLKDFIFELRITTEKNYPSWYFLKARK